jgi:hypothetical protein
MYTLTNFKTKKALREAFNAGVIIECYQPGGLFPGTVNGSCALEGPHYPAPHSWYASAELKDACIVKLDGKARKSPPVALVETATCSESAAKVLRSIGVDVSENQIRFDRPKGV